MFTVNFGGFRGLTTRFFGPKFAQTICLKIWK